MTSALQKKLFSVITANKHFTRNVEIKWKRGIFVTSCLQDEDTTQKMENEPRIPRRVLKRLETRGLTKDDVYQGSRTAKMNKFSESKGAIENQPLSSSKENIKSLVDDMVVQDGHTQIEPEFPSDKDDFHQRSRDQTINAVRPKINPADTSLVLFPGQGSQFVGMGKKLLEYSNVKGLYEMASDMLGYDLLDICLNGPKSQLDKTVVCQPAVFVTSVAAIEKLQELYPQVVENCTGTAGFSVGEYSSLVFSGMLSFRDALKVVKIRAEAMQKASELLPSGMMTVFVSHDSKLNFAMLAAREYCKRKLHIKEPVCGIANYLYSDCKVIAGNEEALQFIDDNKHEFNIKRTKRLPVSGAFHTNLMESACGPVERVLKNVQINEPLIRVHSNVTTKRYHKLNEVVRLLKQQIVKPVKWEQTLHMLYSRRQGENFPNTFEVGPGKQMGTLLKVVNAKAHQNYKNVEV